MALATFTFRKLLLEISKDLRDGELDELKMLCKDLVPPAKAETLKTGQALFTGLEEEGYITASDMKVLKEILRLVRVDLVTKIEKYEEQYQGVAATATTSTESGQGISGSHAPGLKGQIVTEEVLYNIGKSLARDWRSLARCLKMDNDDILKIAADYRDSLEEQGIQMLSKWFKSFGSAQENSIGELLMRSKAANTLDEALRKARLSSIADKVFERVYLNQRENRPQNS